MAYTIEQLEQGIRAADAAGDTASVKALGAEYLRMTSPAVSSVPVPQSFTPSDIPGSVPQPSPTPDPGILEKAGAATSALGGTALAALTGIVAMPYGVAKDVYMRTTGQAPAGVSRAEDYSNEVMKHAPLQPQTPLGRDYQQKIGDVLSSLPAVMPEAAGVSAAAKEAAVAADVARRGNVLPVIGETARQAGRGVKPVAAIPSDIARGLRRVSGVPEPLPARKVPYTPIQQTAAEARDAGIAVPGGMHGKGSIYESAKTYSIASERNAQPAIDHLRKDIGLEPGKPYIAAQELQDVRNEQGARREAVARDVPTVKVPRDVVDQIQAMGIGTLPKSFDAAAKSPTTLGKAPPSVIPTQDVFAAASELRKEAQSRVSVEYGKKASTAQVAEGNRLLAAAKVLDDSVEGSVADSLTTNPDNIKHVGVIKDSRKIFAKAQTIEDVTSPSTSRPDFLALGSLYEKDPTKFDGGTATVGKIASAFPEVMRGFKTKPGGEHILPGAAAVAGHAAIGNTHYAAGRALGLTIPAWWAGTPISKRNLAKSLPENGYIPEERRTPVPTPVKTADQVIADRAAATVKPPVAPVTESDAARSAKVSADRARASQLHLDEVSARNAKMGSDISEGKARDVAAKAAMQEARDKAVADAKVKADTAQKNQESERKKWVDTVNALRDDHETAKKKYDSAATAVKSAWDRLRPQAIPKSVKLEEMKKFEAAAAAAKTELDTARKALDKAHAGLKQ